MTLIKIESENSILVVETGIMYERKDNDDSFGVIMSTGTRFITFHGENAIKLWKALSRMVKLTI